MKLQCTSNRENDFGKEEQNWRALLLNFKTSQFQSYNNKNGMVWSRHKDKNRDQWNRTECPEINPTFMVNLFLTTVPDMASVAGDR